MATKKPSSTAAGKKAPASTAVVTKAANGGAVVSIETIRAQLQAQAAAVTDRIAPPSGVSIRTTQDKQFVLPDGTKTPGPLELVIVDFVSANTYYEGAYDPKNPASPLCFAIGSEPTKLTASDNSPAKQATSCAVCPMNQFGSNGDGKACKNTRVMAVLPPDAEPDTPLWLLRTSPTAIKAFDAYVASVARTFNLPPVGVVTEVSFDSSSSYASLRFGNPRPNENLVDHFARQSEAGALLYAEPDVSKYQPAQKKVASRRR